VTQSGAKVLEGFVKHYNKMVTDPTFEDWYLAFNSFDQKICAGFFTKSFLINPEDPELQFQLADAKANIGKHLDFTTGNTFHNTPRTSCYTPYNPDAGVGMVTGHLNVMH
jgi:hypothetical protein